MNDTEITATESDANTRLDVFLVSQQAQYSRSQIQKLIKQGGVTVDGKPVPAHHFLKAGERIRITEVQMSADTPVPHINVAPVNIVVEEKNFVIVDKPAGLLVHPTEHGHESTLIDQLLELYPEIRQIGEDPLRPGIVHRLDREVSGVMVIARTWEMYEHLKTQFAERKVQKEYHAIVHGIPSKQTGEITFSIGRSVRRKGRMAAKPEREGKRAVTTYEILESFPNYAYLKLMPKTGRMHQIRAHCLAFGHPIVGDTLYHPSRRKNELHALRPLLSSVTLTFLDLTGNQRSFSVPLPIDMQQALAHLRGTGRR